jgi:DNA processing protein
MLAIVGSRRPSSYGKNVCYTLAQEASRRGICIVSGLVLGIDSVAHKASIDTGGVTLAVLPSGYNNIYPYSHKNLADQIVKQGGALISEYEPDAKIAYKGNFIARNRIIAGISQAVLIPEAAEKSGSLHTADFALNSGIEVLAVPGQITNPMASGSNNLIKTGASMVTNISDVLRIFNLNSKPAKQNILNEASNQNEYLLLKLIQEGINDGNKLQQLSDINIEVYNQTITMLELNGLVTPGGGNTWYIT